MSTLTIARTEQARLIIAADFAPSYFDWMNIQKAVRMDKIPRINPIAVIASKYVLIAQPPRRILHAKLSIPYGTGCMDYIPKMNLRIFAQFRWMCRRCQQNEDLSC
jgi:hypothetical protein